MITIEVSDESDKNWNSRLLESGFGTIYQTKEMKVNFENHKFNPKFLKFINEQGDIVGQLLHYETSRFDKGIKSKILSTIYKKLLCKWSYGPIVFDPNYSNEIYQKLGNYLIENKYIVLGTEHPFSPSGISSLKEKFNLKKWSTFLIDLNNSTDSLYKNIDKHNGRKNIERSIKRGVTVEEINETSLIDYHLLLSGMLKNKKRESALIEFEELLSWWNLFKPLGYSGFLAKKDNIAIGGLLFSFFNKHIIEGLVARSEIDYEKKFYSQDLIKWKIIEWGVKNKMNYYNLAGFNPHPESEKEKGIFNYKKKWGGKKTDYWIIRK